MKSVGLCHVVVCQGPWLDAAQVVVLLLPLIRCKCGIFTKMVCELTIERKYAKFEDHIKS